MKVLHDNLKWVVQFHVHTLKLISISFDNSVQLIQEISNFKIKHSNYANWNNETIYILPSCSYHALQPFPAKQLHFISFPYFSIPYFNDTGKTYKKSNFPSNSLVKDIFYFNLIPRSMGV